MASCAWNSTADWSSLSSITGKSSVRTTTLWFATPSENRLPLKPLSFQKDLSSRARPSTSTTSPSSISPGGRARTAACVNERPCRMPFTCAPAIDICSRSIPMRGPFFPIRVPSFARPLRPRCRQSSCVPLARATAASVKQSCVGCRRPASRQERSACTLVGLWQAVGQGHDRRGGEPGQRPLKPIVWYVDAQGRANGQVSSVEMAIHA